MPCVAGRTDPDLWERAKKRAIAKMGGRFSARAMQLAARIYRDEGGDYCGARTKAQKAMKKWSDEDWTTASGDTACKTVDGKTVCDRYLPRKAWGKLTKSQRDATRRKKRASSDQFVPNTKKAAAVGATARRSESKEKETGMSSVQKRMSKLLESMYDTMNSGAFYGFGGKVVRGKGKLYTVSWQPYEEMTFVFADEGLAKKAVALMQAAGMGPAGPRAVEVVIDDLKAFDDQYVAPQRKKNAEWELLQPARQWFKANTRTKFVFTKDVEIDSQKVPAGSTVEVAEYMSDYRLQFRLPRSASTFGFSVEFDGLFRSSSLDEKLLEKANKIIAIIKKNTKVD